MNSEKQPLSIAEKIKSDTDQFLKDIDLLSQEITSSAGPLNQ